MATRVAKWTAMMGDRENFIQKAKTSQRSCSRGESRQRLSSSFDFKMATLYSGEEEKRVGLGWEDLNPEILALILVRIPAEERVGYVSLVCKNWLACVTGPFCWSEIDIQQWCRKRPRSLEEVDCAARKLMKRSRGSFWLLSAYKLGNPGFAFAANCGKNLKVLEIPMSEVTDKMVAKHAESLPNLTVLDISHCLNITSKGIEIFGKRCKSLIQLKRNMAPPLPAKSFDEIDLGVDSKVDESEAMAIANTMPGLTQLELRYGSLGDSGLRAILTSCKGLSHLNIEGSWKVKFYNDDVLDACLKLDSFKGPWIEAQHCGYDSEDEIYF